MGLFIGFVVIFGILAFFYSQNKKNNGSIGLNKNVSITGEVDINGMVPDGSIISISKKDVNSQNFETIISDLVATDKTKWEWKNAKEGQNYEIIAYLSKNGKEIAKTSSMFVSAPATEEILRLNIASPTFTPEEKKQNKLIEKAAISGNLNINGYVPVKSKIVILQSEQSTDAFSVAIDNVNPIDGSAWIWPDANKGFVYTIKAYLYQNDGKLIGQGDPVIVPAPAKNEVLTINSKAFRPLPSAVSISGSINLNGFVPNNSSIVIYQRIVGTKDFLVAVNGVNASNGTKWEWKGAREGTQYELMAVIKQKQDNGTDKDISTSTNLIVSAPAQNEIFNINSNISIPAPNSIPSYNCNYQNGNQWNITMSLNTINNANQYWIQVGTQSGANDIVETTIGQNNSPQISFNVNNNTTYYAHYAYSMCANCSKTNFSAFSNNLVFNCNNQPTAQPTSIPMPTTTPKPAYTGYNCVPLIGCQVTTGDAQFAFSNTGLAQCQVSCSIPTGVQCNSNLSSDACMQAGGRYLCLNGPCICNCDPPPLM